MADIERIDCGSKSTFNITKRNKNIVSFRHNLKSETVTTKWKQNIENAIHSIDIPITVICKNNAKLSCNLQQIINKIAINLRKNKVLVVW